MTATPGPPLPDGSDLLLTRDRAAILAGILSGRTGFTPEWVLSPGGTGQGLCDIFAGFLELLQRRLAQVPDHRQAVLLDMLGAALLPAQGARTHILLTAVPGTRGARVPAGTRIGAKVDGRDAPVVFETQQDVAICPATIVEVHSVVPGADAEQDHSADHLAHRPFTLFGSPRAVTRDLYLGHDELLAFDGRAVVEIETGVAVPAAAPLRLGWSWWDGAAWRDFAGFAPSAQQAGDDDSVDGTSGLTRAGTIRLVAPCAASVPLTLDGRTTHWVRGRVAMPLGMAGTSRSGQVPSLSGLRLRALNEHRRLRVRRSRDQSPTASLRIWWPDAPGTAFTRHLLDGTTGTRSGADVALGEPAVPLPATLTGHVFRAGISLKDARPPSPPAPQPGTDDPHRAAFASDEELTDPLLADPGTVIDISVNRGLPLDKAIADQRAADLSTTFAPLGPSPARGAAFMFACASATRRPGTRVTLVVERPRTSAEKADELTGQQEGSVQAAQQLLAEIITALESGAIASGLTAALTALNQPLPTLIAQDPAAWYGSVRATVQTSLGQLRDAASRDHAVWTQVAAAVQQLDAALAAANAKPGATQARTSIGPSPRDLARVLAAIAHATEVLAAGGATLSGPRAALENAITGGTDAEVAAAESTLHVALDGLLAAAVPFLPAGALPPVFSQNPAAFLTTVQSQLTSAKNSVVQAQTGLATAFTKLKNFNPADLVKAAAPDLSRQLDPPRIAWEYHDGERWRPLGAEGDTQVLSLQDSGSVRFTVPDDIAEVDIGGDVRRWMRARLSEGAYAHLRLVSWTDTSGVLNFLPVVEPRAPMIDRIEVFYQHRSPARAPLAVKVEDDHQWRDLTRDVTWPGPGATPFRPMAETAPTVYLGLDGDLPADRIGLYLQLTRGSEPTSALRPVWEGFDGRGWVRLPSQDGTDGLRRTGVVGLLWPGTEGTPGVTVTGAIGRTITLLGAGAAQRFTPGDRLVLADLQGQEPVNVESATGRTVISRNPLSRAYSGSQMRAAPPSRFGTPRTWIRAVFDPEQPVAPLPLDSVAAHAVEVAQAETLHDEVLGSGDGSPAQVLVARRFPFAGDPELEVRELDGDRADLDADVLTRTLEAEGINAGDARVVRDPRSGRVREVWVRWRPVRSLGQAGPADRAFVADPAQGRIRFGGNGHGRPLPEGRDNVRLTTYRICEGTTGNVGSGTITQLLSSAVAGEVGNPEPATGGAGIETLDRVLARGPALLRHRRLALTERDVAAIAVEASPAVVRARAIGARDRFGRALPGAVRVIIVPRDGTDRPQPGPALLARVRGAVSSAAPLVAAGGVTVEGPVYTPVGVDVTVLPVRAGEAGPVREAVLAALERFLHPLRGGPDGRGWDLGRAVHLSDAARALEAVAGVDALRDMVLTRDGTPVGDAATIGPDEVVCAGRLVLRMGA
ncbi:hypothetical protein [Actinoplanes regularis]|uniref:Putative baseplate assembly protein n=1 Tax=Actinoplanes regularis TaxID=52697 RepID=A0A239C3P4_9ACTN|nr:hypothetical protein [Actinoplanes regularis]GIE88153.1 hypothetical protein Are01nite_46330 [Actinoplanes regularis]SNS14251.1 putative baseplate assembly protein [Actinoplanes regularis]